MFNFKKISAVLTSVVMIGSSVGIAAAANYPAPFVSGGSANVAIVLGTGQGVSTLDSIAAGNIQSDLQAKLGGSGGTTTVTTCAGGDCYLIEQASTKLTIGTNFTEVKSSAFDYSELPNVLKEDTYISGAGSSYGYSQTVNLYPTLEYAPFKDSDYNDNKPALGTKLSTNTKVLNYSITWKKSPQSSVNSAKRLTDFEKSDITLLGKTYTILNAFNASENSGNVKLELMGGAAIDTVTAGEVKEVTVNGVTYSVRASDITSTSEADICVTIDTGEEKCYDNLDVGETRELSNKVQLGIRDINYHSKAGSTDSVDFSIGAEKLTLESGQNVKLNDETIEELTFNCTQSASGTKEQLGTMIFQWTTDDKEFLADNASLVMPTLGGLKITSSGFYTPLIEEIKVTADGSKAMRLEVPLKDGKAKVPLLYGNQTAWTHIGSDDDELLATTNKTSLKVNVTGHNDKYFVASWNSSTAYESYLLSVSSVTKTDNINYTTIKRVGYEDDSLNTAVCTDVKSGNDCKIGNVILTTSGAESETDSVTLTINSGGSFNRVYSAEGMTFWLPWAGNGTVSNAETNWGFLNITVKDDPATSYNAQGSGNVTSWKLVAWEEDKNGNLGTNKNGLNITLGWSGDKARVSSIRPQHQWASDNSATNDPDLETEEDSDKFVDWVLSSLATKVTYNQPSGTGAQWNAEIEYHGGESYGLVYLADEKADVGKVGEATTSTAVSKLGEVLVMDSEVSTVADKNLIIVGGSCINSAAAKALGVSSGTCGAAFTTATEIGSGQFLIQSVGDAYATGKVALVVAGYDVSDTQNAQKFLTTKVVDTTAGKKYKGTSATSAELVTESNPTI